MRRTALILALGLTAGTASATTLIYKDFNALVSESSGIVIGTVAEMESAHDNNGDIVTTVSLERLDVIDGYHAGNTLELEVAGGQVGDENMLVEGMPRFKLGETVLLFVDDDSADGSPTVGWEQGLIRVISNAKDGREVVLDNAGNRILGVDKGRLSKENKHAGGAHLLNMKTGRFEGEPNTASEASRRTAKVSDVASSQPAGGGIGYSDQLSMVNSSANKAAKLASEALSLEELKDAIEERLAIAPKSVAPMLSKQRRAVANTAPTTPGTDAPAPLSAEEAAAGADADDRRAKDAR